MDYVLDYMRTWHMDLLPVHVSHIHASGELPFHHGDPFDRMLVAQSQVENYRLVSADPEVHLYDADFLW